MPEKFFLSPDPRSAGPDAAPLHSGGERVLWSGHCAVAEYAFEKPASLPRWTLPEETEVVVTEQRVLYRDPAPMGTGELHWRWPQHLRVQPGNRDTGRSATVTQIQLVCGGPGETFPALVFAGGDLATVGDADRLANVLRQAITRYRVEHAADLGVTAPQARMLSRLVIGPEFSNYQGGEGQTVSLLAALQVHQQAAVYEPAVEVAPYEAAYPADSYPADLYAAPAAAAAPTLSHAAPAAAPTSPYDAPAAVPAPAVLPAPAVVPAPTVVPAAYAAPTVVPAAYAVPVVPAAYAVPAAVPTSPHAAPGAAADSRPAPAATGYPADQPFAGQPYVPAPRPAEPVPAAGGDRPFANDYAPSPFAGPVGGDTRRISPDRRPRETDQPRPWEAQPDLSSRASDLAARVAMLVSGGTDLPRPDAERESETANLSAYLDLAAEDRPTLGLPNARRLSPPAERDGLSRAESVRRTAARLAGNAPRGRGPSAARRTDDEVGTTSRGGHRR